MCPSGPKRAVARAASPGAPWTAGGLVVLLVALGGAARPSVAAACSCAPIAPAQALEQSDAVFEGRVVAISGVQQGHVGPGDNRVVMRVVRSWKGVETEQVEVTTSQSEATCGYPFEPDQSYLVYARAGGEDGLRTGLCSRTRPIEEAGADLSVLGAGVTPVEVDEREDDSPPNTEPHASRAGCGSCAAPGGGRNQAGWPLAALLGWLIGRARGAATRGGRDRSRKRKGTTGRSDPR